MTISLAPAASALTGPIVDGCITVTVCVAVKHLLRKDARGGQGCWYTPGVCCGHHWTDRGERLLAELGRLRGVKAIKVRDNISRDGRPLHELEFCVHPSELRRWSNTLHAITRACNQPHLALGP